MLLDAGFCPWIPFHRHNEEMSFDFRDQRWLPKSVLSLHNYNFDKFLLDLLAGITVGLVALPLAMAFSIASGLTPQAGIYRSEEHTSELQSHSDLVCRLLLEKNKRITLP